MSTTISCDNCGSAAPDTADDTIGWVRIGWRVVGQQDACSIDCARALLEEMHLWEADES